MQALAPPISDSSFLGELRSACHARDFDALLHQLELAHAVVSPPAFDRLLGYVYTSFPKSSWARSPRTQRFIRALEPWRHPDAAWLIVHQKRHARLSTLRFTRMAHSSLSWHIFRDIPCTSRTMRHVQPLLDAMLPHWAVLLLEHVPAWRAPVLQALCDRDDALDVYLTPDHKRELCSRLVPVLLEDTSCHELASRLLVTLATHDADAFAALYDTLTSRDDVLALCLAIPHSARHGLLDTLGLRHVRIAHEQALEAQSEAAREETDMADVIADLRVTDDWRARRALLCAQDSELCTESLSDAQWRRIMRAFDHAPRHEERLRLLSLLYKCAPGAEHMLGKILKTIRPWREDGSKNTSRASHKRPRSTMRPLSSTCHVTGARYPGYYDYDDYTPNMSYDTFLPRFRRVCAARRHSGTNLLIMSYLDERFLLDHIDEVPECVEHLSIEFLRGRLEALRDLYSSERMLSMSELSLTLSHHPTFYTGFNLLEQYIHSGPLHRRARQRAEQALVAGYFGQICLMFEDWLVHDDRTRTTLNLDFYELPDEHAARLLEQALAHPTMHTICLRGVSDPIALLASVMQDPRVAKFERLDITPSERAWRIYDDAAQRLSQLFAQPHHMHPDAILFWQEEYGVMREEA